MPPHEPNLDALKSEGDINLSTQRAAWAKANIDAETRSWLEEDATDDPDEIRRAQEELEEFKRGINVERERAGARRIYP